MTLLNELLGESPAIVTLRQKVQRLLERQTEARRLPPILIRGETGTGKGLVARAIHRGGPRAAGPLVDVNCAAIPETLIEAELFGFERGAFTDARQAKGGLFQAAHRGTIFLDEIGLLPERLQGKLLTVLEERMVRRLGSTRSEPIDVWVVAATSEDLERATRERRFREDLYHRLAVVTLELPPLRERRDDILGLAEHFLARACAEYGLPPKRLAGDSREALLAYPWPGNIRELANVMERVALLSEDAVVTAASLGLPEAPAALSPGLAEGAVVVPLEEALGGVEQDRVLQALQETNWNISRAAILLGISRNTLRYRIQKYGLRPGTAPVPSPRRRAERPAPPEPQTPAAREAVAPASLGWERRPLAVLQASLMVPAGEEFPPTASRPLEVLVEKVQSFGGRVDELSPTGLVATFGLEPVEDAPRRAALSALAILKAAERARAKVPEPPAVKVGIHTGQYLVGRVSDRLEIELDAKREAWEVLGGLVWQAEPGHILVSAVAARALERGFRLESVGAPGRTPALAYRLVGREQTGFAPGGRMTEFVGREQELELLRNCLESARKGHGQVVGIMGEPGIGKSRLLFEFRRAFATEEVAYLEGHCVSYGATVPYLPVLDLLRAHCGIVESDTPEAIVGKVSGRLRDLSMDPGEAVPYFLHLVGVKEGTEALGALTPAAIRLRTFELLRQMCLQESRRRPLIVAVENLHWADKTSEEYLLLLVESMAGFPILFLATHRPGYRPPWIEKSYATQVALQPLPSEESLRIARSVLGTDVDDALLQLILAKAEGNPFFIEELARTLREQGPDAATLAMPATVQAVLAARIDRLAPEDRRLLQAAAVVGKDVPLTLLREVAEVPDNELRSALARLRAAELLYERDGSPDVGYTFKHALTHDVAYEGLLPEQRRALHARLVEAIERLYSDRLSGELERLAHHSLAGEVWEKAARYAHQAAAKIYARSAAAAEAVVLYNRALLALGHLPKTRAWLEEAVDLRLAIRTPLAQLLEHERILEHLREAERLATALADRRRLGRVYTFMTAVYYETAAYEEAWRYAAPALELVTSEGDWEVEFVVRFFLAQLALWSGHHREALDLYEQAVAVDAAHQGSPRSGVFVNRLPVVAAWTAICLAEIGRFAEAVAHGERALRLGEDEPFNRVVAHLGIGRVHLERGELATAVAALEQALHLCRRTSNRLYLVQVIAALGYARALWGTPAEGLALLETAVSEALARRQAVLAPALAWQGEALFLAGRRDEARSAGERALALARDRGERGHEARVLHLLGKFALDREPADLYEAERHLRQGLALAEALGMRPLLAHCHLGLERLCRRVGDHSKAEEHLTAAVTMYREMDMRLWLAQAESHLAARG